MGTRCVAAGNGRPVRTVSGTGGNLFRYAKLRQETLALRIQSIERNKDQVFFASSTARVDAEKLLRLVTRNKRASFSPQGLLAMELSDDQPDRLFNAINKVLSEIRIR